MKVKEESEKVGLKLNIQKTKIMASGPITSWQINGETVETVAYDLLLCFFFFVNLRWILKFLKRFFSIYGNIYMIFSLSINIVYYIIQ